MRTSCIQHPASEPLVVIRKWQVEFCDGNTTAAALLSFFEYWHNIKLEMQTKNEQANRVAEQHGDTPANDTSLYQWHTTEELEAGIVGLASKNTIGKALELLVKKGAISIHNNPNPRYKFDRTRYFLFHPEPVNDYLASPDSSKLTNAAPKNDPLSPKNDPLSPKNDPAITETTTKPSSVTTDNNSPTSQFDYLADVLSGQKSDDNREYVKDQFFGYRDEFLKNAQDRLGRTFNETEREAIIELAQEERANPAVWDKALQAAILNTSNGYKPAVQRVIEVYRFGGDWQAFADWKWKDGPDWQAYRYRRVEDYEYNGRPDNAFNVERMLGVAQ